MEPNGDLILPEVEAIDYSDAPTPPKSRDKKTLIIIVIAAIALLTLCGALIFVVFQKKQFPPPETSNPSSTEENLPIQNIDAEQFDHTMSLVDDFINVKDYYGAEEYLFSFMAVERMTPVQRYRYYSALVKLYSPEHKDNPELEKTYSMKAEQALNEIREGGK